MLRQGVLAAALLCAGLASAKPDPRPPRKVESAIRKGREWLRKDLAAASDPKRQTGIAARAGPDAGHVLLASFALLHAGLPCSDPAIGSAWSDIRGRRIHGNYEKGLALLLGEALLSKGGKGSPAAKEVRDWARPIAASLASAGRSGTWGYDLGDREEAPRGKEAAGRGIDIPDRAEPIGGDALRKRVADAQGDLSNAQYAILGLKAASLCGIRPDGADVLWRRVAQVLIDTQEKDGPVVTLKASGGKEDAEGIAYGRGRKAKARGWGYDAVPAGGRGAAYGSMTCAGVGSLAIARSEIGDLDAKEREAIDDAIRDGLAWISENFSVERNPKFPSGDMFHFYYLYGLERAGILAGIERIGTHDWYEEGCKILTGGQQADGSWAKSPNEDPVVRASFALLFLSRATSRRFAERYRLGAEGEPTADPEDGSGAEDGR